ncbi:MAG: hypothetical protein A4E37_00532 [Methanoregulaceae archaeon PtaB.Bin056]|jgi:uncharacterized membrane protein|nr:MAG: hypothetical protein A4E37_00532 [Methanoregulaceae archaeon PtaB.Bin056]
MRARFLSTLRVLKELSKALIFFFLFVIAVPVTLGMVLEIPAATILSFLASTFILQAAAPPLGGPLGLSPVTILAVMASFSFGVVLAILEVCESLALTSERVSRWIAKVGKKMEKYPAIQKYGAVSCTLIAWIPGIGLYGTPIIAWILGWNRWLAAVFTTVGFVIAAAFVIFIAQHIKSIEDVFILGVVGAAGIVILVLSGKLARKKVG